MKNLTVLNERNQKLAKGIALAFVVLLLMNTDAFAGETESKIRGVYTWLKPVVNAILMILTLVFAGRCLYKIAFKHEQATSDIAMFIVFVVFWGLWALLANEILQLVGGSSQSF